MNAVLVGIFASFSLSICMSCTVVAASLVISQVQPGDSISASNEAVEIFNNTGVDQDITNWCLQYSSASSQSITTSPRFCFIPADSQTKIYLTATSHASIVTTGYVMPNTVSPDGRFTGSGMAASGGHIRLLNAESGVVDTVGWGTAQFSEGYVLTTNAAPVAPSASQALWRKQLTPATLVDSDNNRADFELKAPAMRTGGIYEVRVAIDICGNLLEIQETLPEGYGYDESGNCELISADMCMNLDAIQLSVPVHLTQDENGGCYTDICQNIVGLQRELPLGFKIATGGCVPLENRPIYLNEILANVAGPDSGFEFIELYNPNSETISLKGYQLQIGKSYENTIVIEDDIVISAFGYVAIYDSKVGFSLLNSESNVRLLSEAGNELSTASYANPKDDYSWAVIDGGWSYTNRPTPGSSNQASLLLVDDDSVVTPTRIIKPCATGKYRHPITNRCRNIEEDTVMLVACESDEYRNPETNRCRKVASLTSILAPCAEGSERNLETNRCRKVAGNTAELVPCQSGYERNPETNRCRKVLSHRAGAVISSASVPSKSEGIVQNILFATAGVGAVSYGLYEWRSELYRMGRRLLQLVTGR